MGKRNHGDADDKGDAAQDHERLASDPVRDHASKQGGDGRAQQHGSHDHRQLPRSQLRSSFQIRQRTADDAYVYSVEQAAKARDQQQEQVVIPDSGRSGGQIAGTHSGYCHPVDWLVLKLLLFRMRWRGLPQIAEIVQSSGKSGRFAREQCAGSAYNDRIEMKRSKS